MKNNLYQNGDYVNTNDGKGHVNEDQQADETTVLVALLEEDVNRVYDVEDVELITSIS